MPRRCWTRCWWRSRADIGPPRGKETRIRPPGRQGIMGKKARPCLFAVLAAGKVRRHQPRNRRLDDDRPPLACRLPARRARRYRRLAVPVAGAADGAGLPRFRQSHGLQLHGQGHDVCADRCAKPPARGLPAEPGPGAWRARGLDDAQHPAIPGGGGGGAARGLRGGQRQPALHPARAGAPAQGFRGAGHHHHRELRRHAAGLHRRHAGQAHRAVRDGRPARPDQGRDRQPRGAQGQEDGAGVRAARRGALQRCAGQGWRRQIHRPGHPTRRHRAAAIHRRHHGRIQGRGAAAPQHHRQRAAVRGLEFAGDGQGAGGRAAHQHLRAAALPHLRLHGEHDAVHAAPAARRC